MNSKQNAAQEVALAEIVRQLRNLVNIALRNPPDFELRWESAISTFFSWIRGLPAAVSPIARNLELLRNIEQEFHTQSLRQDTGISSLLLHGIAKPGEHVIIRGQTWQISNRTISANYGVEFTLTNNVGETFQHEFFD